MPIGKEDKRIIKTKTVLTFAMLELMREKSFENITVNELCSRASVRRATFYKHFKDKYAFLSCLTQMMRDRFEENRMHKENFLGTKEYYTEYVTRLIEYLYDIDEIAKRILASELKNRVIYLIVHQNYMDTRVRLDRDAASGKLVLPASVDVTAAMIVGGVAVAVILWLERGKYCDGNTLAGEICNVLDCIIGTPEK